MWIKMWEREYDFRYHNNNNNNTKISKNDFTRLWWAFFVILDWTVSCCTETQVFWTRELGTVQLQLTLVWLVHKLCPVCQKLWSRAHGRRDCNKRVVADAYSMTIKAIRFLLGKIINDYLSKMGKEQ